MPPGSETKPIDFQHLTTIGSDDEKAKEKMKKKPLTGIAGFHNLSRQVERVLGKDEVISSILIMGSMIDRQFECKKTTN